MKLIWFSLRVMLKKPTYIFLILAVSLIIFLISIWLPSKDLVEFIFTSQYLTIGEKLKFLGSLLGVIKTNFSLAARIFVIILSLLGGINIALFTFYLKRRITLQWSAGVGLLGIIGGLLGVGCASCGSVILTSLIGFSATAGLIGILPFDGLEFAIVGVGILYFSIYLLSKKINDPLLCKVEKPSQK